MPSVPDPHPLCDSDKLGLQMSPIMSRSSMFPSNSEREKASSLLSFSMIMASSSLPMNSSFTAFLIVSVTAFLRFAVGVILLLLLLLTRPLMTASPVALVFCFFWPVPERFVPVDACPFPFAACTLSGMRTVALASKRATFRKEVSTNHQKRSHLGLAAPYNLQLAGLCQLLGLLVLYPQRPSFPQPFCVRGGICFPRQNTSYRHQNIWLWHGS